MSSSSQAPNRNLHSSRSDFTSRWTSNRLESGTKEKLGDFGNLWQFLEVEKERWTYPQPLKSAGAVPVVSTSSTNVTPPITRTGATHPHYSHHSHTLRGEKEPPQLPHSSSSECSSEDELLQRIVTAQSQRTYAAAKKVHFDEAPPEVLVFGDMQERTRKRRNRRKIAKAKQRASNPPNSGANNPFVPGSSFRSEVLPIPVDISDDPVHVFIDNSNIYYGFLQHHRSHRPKQNAMRPELNYDVLFTILERGRNVARKVLVASGPLEQDLKRAKDVGYDVSVLSRVRKNVAMQSFAAAEKEQCVDELLHLKILESLLEFSPPGTIVLASGDGKDGEYFQGGFHKCVVMALTRGWKVEIISWMDQLNNNFLNPEFLKEWKGKYHVVLLDWFANELGCPFRHRK